jgi:hypothetical protein
LNRATGRADTGLSLVSKTADKASGGIMANTATKPNATPKRTVATQPTTTARLKRAPPKRVSATSARTPQTPTTKTLTTKAKAQRFTVNHLNEKDFKRDGLRPYAKYRDLGIAKATRGLAQAHVIRLIPPCTDEVRKPHTHAVELQLIYVLKGWIKNEFDGHGQQLMREGTCWLQPPNIKHTVLDYSDDCEMLEIIVPAKFDTVEV